MSSTKRKRKQPQPAWLRLKAAPRVATRELDDVQPAPERMRAADRSQGPPYLLDKAQVCAIANVSFPTVWAWMRAGQFPRSRVVGGKSMWVSTEIEAWMAALPVRPLKGDDVPHGGGVNENLQ
jgi:predicted DNA-binding transcriptional regulator AlpA